MPDNPTGFANRHYLYTGLTWIISDYTNAGLALISGLSDFSFTPMLTLEHDLFQGMTLSLSAQLPLDRDLFSGDGSHGELGPLPPGGNAGAYFNCGAKVRLRF